MEGSEFGIVPLLAWLEQNNITSRGRVHRECGDRMEEGQLTLLDEGDSTGETCYELQCLVGQRVGRPVMVLRILL